MKKVGSALALVGALATFGAVSAETFSSDSPVLVAQNMNESKDFEALKKKHLASYLADLKTYVKANPKADDAHEAVLEAIDAASEVKDFDSATEVVKTFRSNNGESTHIGEINVAYANAALGSGNVEVAETAVAEAAKDANDQDKLSLYMSLATIQGAAFDIDGAKSSYDELLNVVKGNRQYEQYFKKLKKMLNDIGSSFDDFEATNLEGEDFNTADLRGKVVLYDFWATWCGPCKAELPNVHAAYEEYKDLGFDIVSISNDKTQSALESYLEEHPAEWNQVFDKGGSITKARGVNSFPTMILVDEKGRIVSMNARGEALHALLKMMLCSGEDAKKARLEKSITTNESDEGDAEDSDDSEF